MNELARVYKQIQTRASQVEDKYKALTIRHDKRGHALSELRTANASLLEMNKKLTEERDLLQQKDKAHHDRNKTLQREISEVKAQKKLMQKENELMKEQNEVLKAEVDELKKSQINQGLLCKGVVGKLFKTLDFGKWCMQLTTGAVNLGKNIVLEQLMKVCPMLRLKRKELGWDPSYSIRANKHLQNMITKEPNFKLLTHLQELSQPLTLEEVEKLTEDYDPDVEKDWGVMADRYEYPDANMPYIVPAPIVTNAQVHPQGEDIAPTINSATPID